MPLKEIEDLRYQLFEKDHILAEMEAQKKIVEAKYQKLKMRKEDLESDVQQMRDELCQMRVELLNTKRKEKTFTIGLLVSWLIFAIVITLLK